MHFGSIHTLYVITAYYSVDKVFRFFTLEKKSIKSQGAYNIDSKIYT